MVFGSAETSIMILYAARYLLPVGVALVLAGAITKIVGNVRIKKNPKGKPPSKAWLVLFLAGLCIVVIPAIFVIYTYVNAI